MSLSTPDLSDMPELTGPGTEDAKKYASGMADIHQRVQAIGWLVTSSRLFKSNHFLLQEGVFVQFRKILELIAFASLAAHREQYSAAYKNFQSHWRAKKLLDAVAKLNPEFYPVALLPPVRTGEKSWHFPGYQEDTLTREEFERLYDSCGDILHIRNPFSTKDQTIDIGYSVDEWVARITRLLTWHSVKLVNGTRWMVQVESTGNVHVYPSAPVT